MTRLVGSPGKKNSFLKGLFAIIFVLLSLVLYGTFPAQSQENNQISVQETSYQFVIDKVSAEDERYVLKVLVTGPNSGRLKVEFKDVQDLRKRGEFFPAGSFPHSLINAIQLEKGDLAYDGNSGSKLFDLTFVPKESHSRRIFQGFIAVSFLPDSQAQTQNTSILGALSPLIVAPFGITDDLESGVFLPSDIMSIQAKSIGKSSFIDEIIPDVPGLNSTGPIEVTVSIKNQGDLPNYNVVTASIGNGSEEFLSEKSTKKLLLAGGDESIVYRSVLSDPRTGREINVLPAFGIFTLEVSLVSSLGGQDSPAKTEKSTFIIWPWKETSLALILGLYLIRFIRRRRMHKATSVPTNPLKVGTEGTVSPDSVK